MTGEEAWPGAHQVYMETIEDRGRYADRHGYSFDVIHKETFNGTVKVANGNFVWQKGPIIKRIFDMRPEAEWVWWLDLDAMIMNDAFGLQSYLFDRIDVLQDAARERQRQYPADRNDIDGIFRQISKITLPEINLIVAADMGESRINAGSLLFRRSLWTDMVLDLWTDQYFVEASNNGRFVLEEQGVLTHLIMAHKAVSQHTAAVPMLTINAFADAGCWTYENTSLVVHFAGCSYSLKPGACAEWNKQYRALKRGQLSERPYTRGCD